MHCTPASASTKRIRAGLFLYDHLARRELLPGSCTVALRTHAAGQPLKPQYTTACVQAQRGADGWDVTLRSADGRRHRLQARALVNASGPWAARFLSDHAQAPRVRSLRLVKGSHVIVPRLFDHPYAYILQNPDRRIIFVIPYERDFTLIGTTDVEHRDTTVPAQIDAGEIAYLCEQASRYFARPVAPEDVVHSYSGVRPLLDDDSGDPAAVTRDYSLELDRQGGAPLLNVWGGKITTFRKLAEEASDLLAGPLALSRGPWTEKAWLPGGDLEHWIDSAPGPGKGFEGFVAAVGQRAPDLSPAVVHRLARQYGTEVEQVLTRPRGAEVAPGLFEAELMHQHDTEWARCADDVLWRRTKLGLHYTPVQRAAVADWCRAHWHDHAEPTASSWN